MLLVFYYSYNIRFDVVCMALVMLLIDELNSFVCSDCSDGSYLTASSNRSYKSSRHRRSRSEVLSPSTTCSLYFCFYFLHFRGFAHLDSVTRSSFGVLSP